ncbi:MAG: gliding motility-associated ABC transporter substrate-binding protein GldG [Bacteroidales bacterium]
MTIAMRKKDILYFLSTFFIILAIYICSYLVALRIDLTADNRYTLSTRTQELLNKQNEPILIRVYLQGEMPVAMRTLQRAIQTTLTDMRAQTKGKLHVVWEDLNEGKTQKNREERYREIMRKGLLPFTIHEKNNKGGSSQIDLFPGAIVAMKGKQLAVNFLQSNSQISLEENINNAIQNLEYALVNAIAQLGQTDLKKIAFVDGHGELTASQVGDVTRELNSFYEINRVQLYGDINALNNYDIAIIAKPTQAFSEDDKLVIDQYIMRGGKVFWLIDPVLVHEDSLAKGNLTFGFSNDHNLDDMLFRYGVRVNTNVVQDLQCAMIPVNMSPAGMPAKFAPMPWTYFPLLSSLSSHPISRNLSGIKAEFPGSIDTLSTTHINKKILLTSSTNSLIKKAPFYVGLEQVTDDINPTAFSQKNLPIAVLLEGCFSSIFQYRITSSFNNGKPFEFIEKGVQTQQVIIADGDIIRNEVQANRGIYPLGYDRYAKQVLYTNMNLIKNIIYYLTDENGLMELRSKVVTLRTLHRVRSVQERTMWIILNSLLPLLLLFIGGISFNFWRKKRYATVKK